MIYDHDLVVIGAGSGGVRAARMAATHGAKVVIIEEFRVGGTCVIRGCVPKKLYSHASRFHDLFDVASSFGWEVDASFDWPALVANTEKEITRLESAYTSNLEKPGVEIIKDRGVVTGPNSMHLVGADRDLTAKYILVATGARPNIPHIPGAKLAITSNEVFDLAELPHSIMIEGGGYIAVEFAAILAGLGVNTTLMYRGDCILRGFDEDIRRGLDKAGVVLESSGAIKVDAFSQSTVPSIYAVGDVTGRSQLTPVAIREGWYFAETVFNNNPMTVDHSLIPTAVFSDPEIGVVGLTEAEAATHGDIDRAMALHPSAAEELVTFKGPSYTYRNGDKVGG